VRSSEALAFWYFAGCVVVPWLRPLPAIRRTQIAIAGAAMCAAILAVSHHAPTVVRDWAPGASILVGYYVSGWFFVRPAVDVERWLLSWDRRLLGDPPTRFARWPRALLAYLDLVYMGCFLLVPAGFAMLTAIGRADRADRYWTIVSAAEFGAFAPLVLVQTRPPWILERKVESASRTLHRAVSLMLEHFTIRANTFPSGHVAGSLAVAFAVAEVSPSIGIALLPLAISIAIATVVGRYHYVIDGIAGAVLAVAVWTLARLAGV